VARNSKAGPAPGALYVHIKRFKPIQPGARTASAEDGQKLWEFSERLAAQPLRDS
jgi:hypothetical protein